MLAEVGGEHVGVAHERRAAVAVDHALGIAGGAAGIVERERVPLVGGHAPAEARIALGEEGLVVGVRQRLAGLRELGVVAVDDERPHLGLRQRVAHHGRELAVADDDLGVGVVELEGDEGRVEPRVERVAARRPVIGTA